MGDSPEVKSENISQSTLRIMQAIMNCVNKETGRVKRNKDEAKVVAGRVTVPCSSNFAAVALSLVFPTNPPRECMTATQHWCS